MPECIFCQIIDKSADAEVVYEDDQAIGFRDVHPVTSVHVLVIPKKHVRALDELSADNTGLAGHLLLTARRLGQELSPHHGYRIVVNGGGQEDVDHLHFHVMGGHAALGEPAKGVNDK